MDNYTDYDIDLFRTAIEDYKELEKDIKEKVENGYTIQHIYDYLKCLEYCNIIGVDFDSDWMFIDFGYKNMLLSVDKYSSAFEPRLADTLEIWNDKDRYYLGVFNNVKELEDIVKDRDFSGV